MKTYVTRIIALLIFASVAFSGCSVQYRAHRDHMHDQDHGHDHDHNQNYHQ